MQTATAALFGGWARWRLWASASCFFLLAFLLVAAGRPVQRRRGSVGVEGVRKGPWPQHQKSPSPPGLKALWEEEGGGRRKKWFGSLGRGEMLGLGKGCVSLGTSLSTREREREEVLGEGTALAVGKDQRALLSLWDTHHSRKNTLFFKVWQGYLRTASTLAAKVSPNPF